MLDASDEPGFRTRKLILQKNANMPAYAPYDSFASSRRTADSIYYTAKEYDSADEADLMRHMMVPAPHSRRPSVIDPMGGPVDTIFSRRYVDPWDLENYVYIRK